MTTATVSAAQGDGKCPNKLGQVKLTLRPGRCHEERGHPDKAKIVSKVSLLFKTDESFVPGTDAGLCFTQISNLLSARSGEMKNSVQYS